MYKQTYSRTLLLFVHINDLDVNTWLTQSYHNNIELTVISYYTMLVLA